MSRTMRPATVPASRPSYTLRFKLISDLNVRRGNEDALLECIQGLGLEEDLDLSTSGDVDSLDRILTVTINQSD